MGVPVVVVLKLEALRMKKHNGHGLVALVVVAALIAHAQAGTVFEIDQPFENGGFGGASIGQTFTPNVGTAPSLSGETTLGLTVFELYQGTTANNPSPTTYLKIYDADPSVSGTFIGVSRNFLDTADPPIDAASRNTKMAWAFDHLNLNVSTMYWAVMSSSNSSSSVDETGVSLLTQDPAPYAGGTGIIANFDTLGDTQFRAQFSSAPPVFTIDQPVATGSFGGAARGQTFTTVDTSTLTAFNLYYGTGGGAGHATTYLNIYDGDPDPEGSGANFVGSSTNAIDTTVLMEPGSVLNWTFDDLALDDNTKYWAVMSSTNVDGNVDVGLSFEQTTNVYAGGAGIIGSFAEQGDLRFTAEFVPEPSTLCLLWLGVSSLLVVRRRHRR
jgi:hypothetical protein